MLNAKMLNGELGFERLMRMLGRCMIGILFVCVSCNLSSTETQVRIGEHNDSVSSTDLQIAGSITFRSFIDTLEFLKEELGMSCERVVNDLITARKLIRAANTLDGFTEAERSTCIKNAAFRKVSIAFDSLFKSCDCIGRLMVRYKHSIALSTRSVYFSEIELTYAPSSYELAGNSYLIQLPKSE